MADEPHVIRGINWRETFPFTNIFRSFRIAIHPSKLVLALAALFALYLGGRALDAVWPSKARALPQEVAAYQQWADTPVADRPAKFAEGRKQGREGIERQYAQLLVGLQVKTKMEEAETAAKDSNLLGDVKKKVHENLEAVNKKAKEDYDAAMGQAKKTFDQTDTKTGDAKNAAEKAKEAAEKAAKENFKQTKNNAFLAADATLKQAEQIKGKGLFISLFEYQAAKLNAIIQGVYQNNWLGGLDTAPAAAEEGNPFARRAAAAAAAPGVVTGVIDFFTVGPTWMLTQHPIYFILFAILFMAVWSVFGGAIARIAAVHVARDEKLSVKQALRFSISKFLSFFFAPIIPLAIVLVVGIFTAIGGLLANIPGIGSILVGLLFFLALGAGFVMTLVLLGTGGGFNLMYPTVAVEGSDSFDAISRSFSYVYARPWRMIFYSFVALVYGALCYLFVRLFVYMILALTHSFAGWWVWRDADNTQSLWNTVFPEPTFWKLPPDINFTVLSGSQDIGAFLMAFWIFLLIATMGAFLISFYFSANTVIYYLMRREVDATEMDDVYVEQAEEELPETTTATPVAAAVPAPAAETPATPPAEAPAPPPAETPAPRTEENRPSTEDNKPSTEENKPPTNP